MIISDDIYMAAYLQVSGLQITDIKLTTNNGGHKVEFALSGEKEEEITADYQNGIALVNVKDYLYKLFEIRDVMYSMKNSRKTSGGHNEKHRFRKV